MPGVTPWQQFSQAFGLSAQNITTTTETVIGTIAAICNRSPGSPVFLDGFAQFAIQAATTSTTLRIRQSSLTGTVVGNVTAVLAETAGTIGQGQLSIATVDLPAGELHNMTYVLTIQAAAAGANWNVNLASLQAYV